MPQYSVTKKILFVHNAPTSFVVVDRDLLQQRWQIREWNQRTRLVNPIALAQAVGRCDLVFCWFASWHSFVPVLLARLLGKPTIVVVGGYDTANLPEAGYGSQRGGLRRLVARSVVRQADHLVAFSHSARREAISNAKADPGKVTVTYLGVPPLPEGSPTDREDLVITVGNVWRENLLRKGLLPFVQAAAYLPEVRFMLVGKWYDDSIEALRRAAGPNVAFTGFVSGERLTDLYRRASVYVQASLHEGFGMSVAEAMLAGCIPVVTRNGSLPEVVGDTGVYVESNDPTDIAGAIRRALELGESTRRRARERILVHFPVERRRQALNALIDQLLNRDHRILAVIKEAKYAQIDETE